MNIELVVHHELGRDSGAPGQTHQLCEQYRREGHSAEIYSWSDLPTRLSPRQKQLLFPAYVAVHLAQAIRRRRIDVIDASTGDAWIWALLDPACASTLLVTRSHGLEHVTAEARRVAAQSGLIKLSWKHPFYYGGFHLWEVRQTLRQADLVLLLNRHDQAYAVERLGIDPRRAHVVGNGIGEAFVGLPVEPTPPPDPSEHLRIALVFSHLPLKGVVYGTQALATVLERHPRLHATFLGTGAGRETTLCGIPSHLWPRIDVVPQYANAELPAHLRGHQIVLFPTLTEGFGVALVEAMACGLVPVATATPGPSEFVVDGQNGFLVPTHDSEALVYAIERLVENPELLDRLRRAAHARAQGLTARAAAQRCLRLYETGLASMSVSPDRRFAP